MPRNALDNALVLPILGLLAEQSRHQYALLSELRTRYTYLEVKTSTVYTLVQSLARHGLVGLDASDEVERQRVSLTSDGFAELRRKVEQHLLDSNPSADPKFAIALAYLGVLTQGRATRLLRKRAEQLRADLQTVTDTLNHTGLPELHMIEAHFLASRLEHDAAWLTRLADRIQADELDWSATHAD